MRHRLYFVLPNVRSAREIADDLLLARIEDRYMYFLARHGVQLGNLHEASLMQKTDFLHAAGSGMVLGGIAGLIAGVIVLLTPPEGIHLQLVTVLIFTLIGAVLRKPPSTTKLS